MFSTVSGITISVILEFAKAFVGSDVNPVKNTNSSNVNAVLIPLKAEPRSVTASACALVIASPLFANPAS